MSVATSAFDRAAMAGKWFKTQFAEWFIGSWALILGWGIIAWVFSRLIVMDGHFSRGLGEGSGVDPGLFQQVGWAYRCFAAAFLVIAYKMTKAGLRWSGWAIRLLGIFCTVIVFMHAVGFGLKALEAKRDSAVTIVEVAAAKADSSAAEVAQLKDRKAEIDADLAKAVEPLQERMSAIVNDGQLNDSRSDALETRVQALQDAATAKKDAIDVEIKALVEKAGTTATQSVEAAASSTKFEALFVGLASLFTWTREPSEWSAYLAGVIFIVFWMLLGDLIVIVGPECLYKLHLKESRFKRASEAGAKGGNETAKRRNEKFKMIAMTTVNAPPKRETGTDDPAWNKPDPRNSDPSDEIAEEENGDANRDSTRQAAE